MERSRKQPNVDRLSSLPDSILSHILSFLPTKFSTATSILARRWRFLWADVPILDLDFQFDCNWNEERPRISDIINRIVLGHTLEALDTFRLRHKNLNAKDKLTQHEVETWIAAVIARGKVRNIELEFSDLIKMPECLFTYKSLVELRLYKCEIRISVPASISFPSLEKLHLRLIKYNNDETFQHLISGCSILKELMVIQYFDSGGIVCSRISSPTLKWLTINVLNQKVEIITPALRYLRVMNYSSVYVSAKDLSSLTEADIRLRYFKEFEDDVVYSLSVWEFLDKMPNIKCLKFNIYFNKFLHSAFSYSSPRFHSLTKLDLAADWCFILKFLEMADNLQVLTINPVAEDLKCWVEPQQVFPCLLSHLTIIVIISICCQAYEYKMVRYLLKNARVLKRMTILCPSLDDNEKFVAAKRILQFRRASDACKVDFY